MFSDAISSISCRWRPSSPLIAAAISGSASASVAVKNESGAEAVLELERGGHWAKYLHRRRPLGAKRAGLVWRSKEVPARYHIGRNWPSTCGTGLVFMPDMVGRKPPACGRPPGCVQPRPTMTPSFTTTAPTAGFGQVRPSPRRPSDERELHEALVRGFGLFGFLRVLVFQNAEDHLRNVATRASSSAESSPSTASKSLASRKLR